MAQVLNSIDYKVSKAIHDAVSANWLTEKIPVWFGLWPYELYVIPGMYIGILQVIWLESMAPVQFHLLPHFFAFSIFQGLKKSLHRARPGCVYKDELGEAIDPGHCTGSEMWRSFPSGHAGIAFALATALAMEMLIPVKSNFFDIRIVDRTKKLSIASLGIVVAVLVSVHRVAKGYHYVSDVLAGAVIGCSIGYTSWHVMDTCRRALESPDCPVEEEEEEEEEKDIYGHIDIAKKIRKTFEGNKVILSGKIVLTIVTLFLLFKFLFVDIWKMAALRH